MKDKKSESFEEEAIVKMVNEDTITILYCESCQKDIKVVKTNKPQKICPHIILKE